MSPCRHIQWNVRCAIGRLPMDCPCRAYDKATKSTREEQEAWAKATGSDRSLALYALTHAAIGVAIMATIGVTAMLL